MRTNEELQTETFDSEDLKSNSFFGIESKIEKIVLAILLAMAVLIWLPRLQGPIDLRWDGGVYYILGTSLAEGKGYKLLNEPGEIDAVQYPPLLPLIIAGHQIALGTSDSTVVGWWLRISSFIVFLIYIYFVFSFLKNYLSTLSAFFASVICLFSLHVYFLSDLCFPEIPFSLATLLFILFIGKNDTPKNSILTYIFAVISYALRTVGIVVLAVWVLDSLLRKKFKQAAVRILLVLIPIFCWQFYIASVEASDDYNNPAYAYQRAPYMFYNVTYTRNVSLHDPFAPEKGERQITKIVFNNMLEMPADLGEAVSTLHTYWRKALSIPLGKLGIKGSIAGKLANVPLYILGFFVLGGLILQLKRKNQPVIPLYVLTYVAALCLIPFPRQNARYLMPLTPFLVLALFIFLSAVKSYSEERFSKCKNFGKYVAVATLSAVLLAELFCLFIVFTREHQQVEYVDKNNRLVKYRLIYYADDQKDFDECVSYLNENAQSEDIIASGTPHWVYLRTGLKSVMTPFEKDTDKAQQLLDGVPVNYLIVGEDVIESERYILPVISEFSDKWKPVFAGSENKFAVYKRVGR